MSHFGAALSIESTVLPVGQDSPGVYLFLRIARIFEDCSRNVRRMFSDFSGAGVEPGFASREALRRGAPCRRLIGGWSGSALPAAGLGPEGVGPGTSVLALCSRRFAPGALVSE